ncbi:MAG: PaaI family thioesterase [Burkholderiaceae bacterium]
MTTPSLKTAQQWTAFGQAFLPGLLGIEVLQADHGVARLSMPITQAHFAPNGFLHAGAIVTLADTACGYGCVASLPQGASGFTTIELKSNHLGTAREGQIEVAAKLFHGGRTTQVWDAHVTHGEKVIALFRCTQMILYPKA